MFLLAKLSFIPADKLSNLLSHALKQMNIDLQIEQLVLEAVDLAPGQRSRLKAALQAELTRILNTQPLPTRLQKGAALPKLSISLDLPKSGNPIQMGHAIARSVYHQMAQPQ